MIPATRSSSGASKAAKFELPVQLAQPAVMQKPDLTVAIIQAVKAHPANGAVADEAFIALTLDAAHRLRNTPSPAIIGLIPQIIDLERFGFLSSVIRPLPTFLPMVTRLNSWSAPRYGIWNRPAQQQQVMDLLYSYLAAASKLWSIRRLKMTMNR